MADQLSIQKSISEATDELESSQNGDLPLQFRRMIMSKLGPGLGGGSPPSRTVGYVRRVRLAIVAVEKSAPIWKAALPDDRAVDDALLLAHDVMTGAVSAKVADSNRAALWTYCDDLSFDRKNHQIPALVGYAAAQVIAVALWDPWGGDPEDDTRTDRDLDPDEFECSFLAASAWSGGTPWMPASSPERREEYWRWWLCAVVEVLTRS